MGCKIINIKLNNKELFFLEYFFLHFFFGFQSLLYFSFINRLLN